MGKYKFRFSDMIPNAWFHKLKDMSSSSSSSSSSKPRSKTLNPTNNNKHYSLPSYIDHNLTSKNSDQRKSYYISRDLDSPPPPRRRSTKRNNRPRPPPPPQPLSTCSCRATVEESVSPPSPEESGPDQSSSSEQDSVITEYGSGRGSAADSMVSWSSPCKCGNKNDIIIDIDNTAEAGEDHCCRRLAPIITKNSDALSIKVVKEDHTMARRMPARSPGMRLRVNSPRIGNRRIQGGRKSVSSSRRSISDSLAVVKASKDPRRDFRESMVEMIMENNIKASKDLEELLACYLSLNSEEYHDLIINVFKQIWFDIFHLRLN